MVTTEIEKFHSQDALRSCHL